jgi:hypothetical protein
MSNKTRLNMYCAKKKTHKCDICGKTITKRQKYFRMFDFTLKKDMKAHYKCFMQLRRIPEWSVDDAVYDMVVTYDQLEAFALFLNDLPNIIKTCKKSFK